MNDIKAFFWRGAAAGAIAGLAAALFQWIVVERQIDKALAIEAANAVAGEGGDEMFTRVQQVSGGMLAAVIYGTLLGLVFGFAAAVLWPRLPGTTAFSRSIRLAVVAFVAWSAVPNLKYPANPPAVGDPDTVGERTAWYLCLMAVSLVLAYLAWELWQRLTARGVDGAERFAAVGLSYLAAVTLAWVLFPANPDALEVPANLIWHFRVQSLAGNAILWIVAGTAFGYLADRVASRATQPAPVRTGHPA
jgi:hypothetical protein